MASDGIVLQNYYVAWQCNPTRASFLTGRYNYRLGYSSVPGQFVNLPLEESTVAEELKRYGYRTALIGKWHMGFQAWPYTPTHRGFDTFYGYYGGHVDYWSKVGFSHKYPYELDLTDQTSLVTDAEERGEHMSLLLGRKASGAIQVHAELDPEKPLFLFYSMLNVHSGTSGLRVNALLGKGMDAPSEYLDKCTFAAQADEGEADEGGDLEQADPEAALEARKDHQGYCALLVMLDEAVGDLLCALDQHLDDSRSTLVVVSSDNGAWGAFPEGNVGVRGQKANLTEGGIHAPALLWAPRKGDKTRHEGALIPEAARGTRYHGIVHVTDWLPTFLGLASGGAWAGPLSGRPVDGLDMWTALTSEQGNSEEAELERELVHNVNPAGAGNLPPTSSIQLGLVKLIAGAVHKYGNAQVAMEPPPGGEAPRAATECLLSNFSAGA
mmetsp:Transcript_9924/g.22798  ORF Transcript_9924/g.22798 Transcript_9924/m.22798 type:complete len:439 (-) Transcript_9924:21-1337(-)